MTALLSCTLESTTSMHCIAGQNFNSVLRKSVPLLERSDCQSRLSSSNCSTFELLQPVICLNNAGACGVRASYGENCAVRVLQCWNGGHSEQQH